MSYLISQYAVWLVLALIIGGYIGWTTCASREAPWLTGWVRPGLIAFAIGLAIAALKLFPGRLGLWLDSLLLLFAAYIIGCLLGWLARWMFGLREAPEMTVPALAGAAGAAIAARAPAPVPPPAPPRPAATAPAPAQAPAAPPPGPAPVKPYVWRAERAEGGVTLSGHVPSEDVRKSVVTAAKAALPGLAVNDKLSEGAGAPEGLAGMAAVAFDHLAGLSKGTASLTDGAYTLAGSARTRADYDTLTQAVKTLPKGFGLWRADITAPAEPPKPAVAAAAAAAPAPPPPPAPKPAAAAAAPPPAPKPAAIKPYQWQASRDKNSLLLTGYAPSEQARGAIVDAAKRALPSAVITDRLLIGAGAPGGFEGMANAAFGHLARLERGTASLVDASYTLTGQAAARSDYDAVLAGAKSLPQGFTLWRADILAPPAPAPAAPAPAPAPAAPPEPPAAAKVEGEDDHEGKRPPGLASPRGGKADDLKRIRGIGKQNEGRLHGLGIWHFDQVAGWTHEHALWVGSYLAFKGRIEREEWISQAKVLAAGGETEFSKRADAGLVPTSADDGSKGQANVAAGVKPQAT